MQISILLLVLFAPAIQDPKTDTPKTPPTAGANADKKVPVAKKPLSLAIIVHPKNPLKKISYSDLRRYLKMSRQFWPNRKRCDLYLPSHKTDSYKLLLKIVYKTSHKKLQKTWVRKVFSGDIPSKPSSVRSPTAAGKQVSKNVGALSIVPSDKVPKGVRVLLVDGKKPGADGYKLTAKK
jgi:hypothetical protein